MNSDVRTLVSRRALRREVSFFARMADLSEGTDDHALWCQVRDELAGYLAAVDPDQVPRHVDQGALFGPRSTETGPDP